MICLNFQTSSRIWVQNVHKAIVNDFKSASAGVGRSSALLFGLYLVPFGFDKRLDQLPSAVRHLILATLAKT